MTWVLVANDLLPFTDMHTIIIMVEENGNLPVMRLFTIQGYSYKELTLVVNHSYFTRELLLLVFFVLVYTLVSYRQFVAVCCVHTPNLMNIQ